MNDWKKPLFKLEDVDTFVDELLEARGVDINDIDAFLSTSKKKLHNPYKMKDMKVAVYRIIKAIQSGEKIGIFGDYDTDGVTSTSILVQVLTDLGADVVYFVPDRQKDGYGVGRRGIDFMANNGVELCITCDTGITAVSQVHELQQRGIDVIVTDHHEPQMAEAYTDAQIAIGLPIGDHLIPKCTAVVNMKRPDCKYPFKGLAGVGVAFKVLCAVAEKIHPEKRKLVYKYLDLVALGTVADMMELTDENRVLVHYGLKRLNNTRNRGLYQLIRANNLKDKELTSQDIGWTLAPCINAAGRIVSAEQAVDMVISDNRLDAYRYAKELVNINSQRKELTKTYVKSIIDSIEADDTNQAIIIQYFPAVPEGIIGLIAGRVTNHFNRPCIVVSDSEDPTMVKGSGRSIDALNLFETLLNYTDTINFGGHHMACGLSLEKDDLDQFKDSLEFYVDTLLTDRDMSKQIHVDCEVKPNQVTMELLDQLSELEPFGNGHKKPVFLLKNVFIMKEKPVGDDKNHLWALMKAGNTVFSSIGFFLYEDYVALGNPKKVDVLFTPDLNEYPAGKFNVQLKVEAVRKAK